MFLCVVLLLAPIVALAEALCEALCIETIVGIANLRQLNCKLAGVDICCCASLVSSNSFPLWKSAGIVTAG